MKHPLNWLNVQQGSPEWLIARCGKVTASHIADVMIRTGKNGDASRTKQARERYKMEVLTEILTGSCVEHYVSPAMDWGTEHEPLARAQYELVKECEVERVGFVIHPRIPRSGASPDGCIGENGLIEIKCPQTATHLKYFIEGVVPADYIAQMQWQLACTEYDWCDLVSYDPRLPEDFSLFIIRMERDNLLIAEMEKQVEKFIGELNEMCEKLQAAKREIAPRQMPPAAEIPARFLWVMWMMSGVTHL